MDHEEFHEIQRAYLRASVVDIEVPTDHGIVASIYLLATKNRIKTYLTGSNYATESIMPSKWSYRKNDLPNLLDIYRQFGKGQLSTFPTMSLWKILNYRILKGIDQIPLLDHVQYNKAETKQILVKEMGWQDYGGKHCESVFTRFYQCYILPTKFGVDKRKAHLSNLVNSGQMTREEALKELEKPLYTPEELAKDREHVLSKLCLTEAEFDEIMKAPIRDQRSFASDEWLYRILRALNRLRKR